MPAELPSSDDVADALAGTWALLGATLSRGWSRPVGRATAIVTGMPVSTLNGVWTTDEQTPADDIARGLHDVAGAGVPYCLQARPGCATASGVAERCGLVHDCDIPLMATSSWPDGPACAGLELRHLEPDEAALHCSIAGPAFDAPPELLEELISAQVLGLPEVRGYVGEVGGSAVVTAISVRLSDSVGIFNVATPQANRRRGYGAAVTARALHDGFQDGARWGWLQASDAGYGVYEALGFRTLERWPCWVTAG